MISSLPLLFAAASVGVLHMSAPDHWATLVILGRVSGWNRSRLLGVGVMTAVGHACVSILLGFAIVVLGLIFSRQVSVYLTEGTGLVMVGGGLIYGVRELIRSSEVDLLEKKKEEISTGQGSFGSGFRYFTVLGAALSPDLSVLPIFLLAVPVGLGLAVETAIVFGVASVAALLLFLLLGSAGLARALERIPPRYSDALVGFVIAAVGAYILIAG
jgi:high-affinity Fe2+/Pb2+ permease